MAVFRIGTAGADSRLRSVRWLDWQRRAAGRLGWVEAGLTFFYPDLCQLCRAEPASSGQGYVGLQCRREVRLLQGPRCERCGLPFEGELTQVFTCANCRDMELHFSRARAAVAARGLMLDLIHRWKYSRALWFEPFLAELLSAAAGPTLLQEGWDLVVPVPLHPVREREREFNQAERLARRLARQHGLPLLTGVVSRGMDTRPQTRLSREARAENMRSVFQPGRSAQAAEGRRVVLVDDVLTTGATASACARVLRRVGAAEVCVWTLARGLLH